MVWRQIGQSDLPRGLESPGDMAWRQEGQSDLLRDLNPKRIELSVRKDSQIFPELESPRDMDSDVSAGRGEGRVADVACLSRPCYKRASWQF
jgi:hypothetical protein